MGTAQALDGRRAVITSVRAPHLFKEAQSPECGDLRKALWTRWTRVRRPEEGTVDGPDGLTGVQAQGEGMAGDGCVGMGLGLHT